MAEKHKARLAAFVVLERDGKVLLARRANTGYADGMYQMPSGHVEAEEYPSEATVREAKEEVGVDVALKDLEFMHVSYRINKIDNAGDYVDFFFKATKWEGEPYIAEPDKCDGLLWAPLDALPENTVPTTRTAIEEYLKNKTLSEVGRPQ